MFGFIKNLFGGIAAFFSGLFSKKSKEASDNQSIEEAPKAPKPKKAKGFYLELDDTGNIKTEAQEKKPKPAKAAVATAEPSKAESAAPKKSEPPKVEVESKNGKVKVEAQPNPPAPAVAASNGKVDPQVEKTFAPNYLLSTTNRGRRRPGPSLDVFRDMARQVKTPS